LITGPQLKAARALVGLEQAELAKRARVARGTIRRMESFPGEIGSQTSTLAKVRVTLERAGVEFLYGDQPGVRLRLSKPGGTALSERPIIAPKK
jgi:predicted transcriptional regulator